MLFDSVSIAKAFYYTYSEKMGFKARTGSGRRSRDNRMLIMQRFLCCRGNPQPVKSKRGPARLPLKEVAAAGAAEEGDTMEAMQLESGEHEREVESGLLELSAKIPIPKTAIPRHSSPRAQDDAEMVKDGGKVPLVLNPGQSRLLRELGIRVSRYTQEERRDIILKYMQKRNSRQVVDRSIKVPSRQALAGRRQRGFGGKFLSKEEMETVNRQEETVEEEPELPADEIANAGGVPIVGLVFENEDKAYEYYVKYAGNVGFSVRKGWWDKSRNVTRSRVFLCSREGFRPKNAASEARRPRPETRTGCPARMAIKITSKNKYRVTEFVSDHNHPFVAPLDAQIFTSQKLFAKAESASRQISTLIPADYKNYLRAKRMKDMQMGDAGALLEYLQKMKGDNPSFYYAIQVDEDDQMTNVFWADAKSVMDYYYFGDVVCFDTSYRANNYGRPLALFIGTNHHKQTVIFGAAFLYDETVETFRWLFDTFKTAMCGRQPKTILTDRLAAIGDAVSAVWPGTIQRHCVWQIYQNAVKNIFHVCKHAEAFAHDFSRCLYDFEDEDEFVAAWTSTMDKYNFKDNEWLSKLYEDRKKWAFVYGRDIFCADINSMLQCESLNTLLKECLNPDIDLFDFFKQYERIVDGRRYAELQADYHANQGNPQIPPLRLLWQAANAYTPTVFEMFRREFEMFLDSMLYRCAEVGTVSEYAVSVKDRSKQHFVRYDLSDGTIKCSCKKFEFIGIQCFHVLKVLDFRHVKELPQLYVLKRWRKDAKSGSSRENYGFTYDGDPSLSLSNRFSSLCRMLYRIAEKAAENMDTFTLMIGQSDQLLEQVEKILQTKVLEKPSITSNSKGHSHNLVDSESTHQNSTELEKSSGKRKKDKGVRRRHQNGLDVTKRQKQRKGYPDEAEAAPIDNGPSVLLNNISSQPRNPANQFLVPNHFMQGPYVSGHQFGLATQQGSYGMSQFGQDASASTLQQPFHDHAHMSQNVVQGFPSLDLHTLQFVGNNPPLDPQSEDQTHCAIPTWDFL